MLHMPSTFFERGEPPVKLVRAIADFGHFTSLYFQLEMRKLHETQVISQRQGNLPVHGKHDHVAQGKGYTNTTKQSTNERHTITTAATSHIKTSPKATSTDS
jgi:hypothetical protein